MTAKRIRMLSVLKVLHEVSGLRLEVLNNGYEVEITYWPQHSLVKKFHGWWYKGNRWVFHPTYPGQSHHDAAKNTLWTPMEAKQFVDLAAGIAQTCSRRRDPR